MKDSEEFSSIGKEDEEKKAAFRERYLVRRVGGVGEGEGDRTVLRFWVRW